MTQRSGCLVNAVMNLCAIETRDIDRRITWLKYTVCPRSVLPWGGKELCKARSTRNTTRNFTNCTCIITCSARIFYSLSFVESASATCKLLARLVGCVLLFSFFSAFSPLLVVEPCGLWPAWCGGTLPPTWRSIIHCLQPLCHCMSEQSNKKQKQFVVA